MATPPGKRHPCRKGDANEKQQQAHRVMTWQKTGERSRELGPRTKRTLGIIPGTARPAMCEGSGERYK